MAGHKDALYPHMLFLSRLLQMIPSNLKNYHNVKLLLQKGMEKKPSNKRPYGKLFQLTLTLNSHKEGHDKDCKQNQESDHLEAQFPLSLF